MGLRPTNCDENRCIQVGQAKGLPHVGGFSTLPPGFGPARRRVSAIF
jgi:hypothetical protein